jgi:adenylate cyclase
MKRLVVFLFQGSLKKEWPQTLFLLLLFAIFISNAIGLIDFKNSFTKIIDIRPEIFSPNLTGFSIPQIISSAEFWLLVVSGLVLVVLLPVLTPIGASIVVFILAIPPLVVALNYPYRVANIPMEFHWLVLLVMFGINVLLKYFVETHNKQKLINIFSQFVPPEIVRILNNNPDLLSLTGESRYLTVFFCDLRNFTGMSEKLDPKDVALILNEFFTTMTAILFKHGATIDKYIGDSIMAFWGAPVPQEDHAARAVMVSFEMHAAMKNLGMLFESRGLPPPSLGIGINSGLMNVGNMGSLYRLSYTVIGDVVNQAARFQSTTKEYGVGTIVGESTVKDCPEVIFRELDTVTVRGKTNFTRIYEPLCLKKDQTPAIIALLEKQENALNAYYSQNFKMALNLFTDLNQPSHNDSYYSSMLKKASAKIEHAENKTAG